MKLDSFTDGSGHHVWIKYLAILLIGVIGTALFLSARDYTPVPFLSMDSDGSYGMDMAYEESVRSLSAPAMKMAVGAVMDDTAGNAYQNTVSDRKIIRSGSLSIEVEDTENTVDQVKTIIESQEGFIDNLNVYEWRYNQKKADLSLRIPAEKFSETVSLLKELGQIQSESENTQDITDAYTDNEARIENLKAREEQLRKFFNQAQDVSETMQVYRELENVRYEIENLERQQLRHDKQVSYSSLRLEILPEIVVEEIQNEEWSVKKVWRSAVNNLKGAFRYLAEKGIAVVVYATIWIPILIILLIIRWVWKRRRG